VNKGINVIEHKVLAAVEWLLDAIMKWMFIKDYFLQSKSKETSLYTKQMICFFEESDFVLENEVMLHLVYLK